MKNSSKFNSLGGFPDLESFKDESGKYGYREKKTQKIFIAPQFDAAYSFHEGIAAVKVDHKYGHRPTRINSHQTRLRLGQLLS